MRGTAGSFLFYLGDAQQNVPKKCVFLHGYLVNQFSSLLAAIIEDLVR